MSSRAWMPLYVGDYLADTSHLDAEAHGVYLLLLMRCWTKGSLPEDRMQCMSIAHAMHEHSRSIVDAILTEFFTLEADGFHNKRIDLEREKSGQAYERRAGAARVRWEAKHSSCNADPMHMQPQPQPQPQPDLKPEPFLKRKGARKEFLPPTLDEWQAYCAETWSDWHPSRSQESHEYYAGVNWRVGAAKKQAEDWRACARTAHTNAVKWGNLNQIMPAPSMAEWLEFAGAFAAQNAPFPTEPRFIWPEDLAKAAFSRHKAANWLRISDWRSQAKADCREWVGREISNRQRPNR